MKTWNSSMAIRTQILECNYREKIQIPHYWRVSTIREPKNWLTVCMTWDLLFLYKAVFDKSLLFLWLISKAALSIGRNSHLSLPSSFQGATIEGFWFYLLILSALCPLHTEATFDLETKPVLSLLGIILQFSCAKKIRPGSSWSLPTNGHCTDSASQNFM